MTRSCIASLVSAVWLAQGTAPARTGVVSGRVTDEFGDPVINARVVAEAPPPGNARPASGGPPAPATVERPRTLAATSTDDRGDYRLAGVAAGDCAIAVMRILDMTIYSAAGVIALASGASREPEKTYYPGKPSSAEADRLTIVAGQEQSGIDFVLRALPPALPPVAAMRIAQAGGAAPRNPDATAIVRGRIGTTDGRALPHAHVQLLPEIDLLQSAATAADADGRFEFRDLAAGKFRIVAAKAGFAAVDTDASDLAGTAAARTIELAAHETRERVDLTLARWGAISGTVVNEVGASVRGASVQLLQIRYSRGRRRLTGVGQATNPTDDLGRYRIYAVAPGQYVVSATVGGASSADVPGYARAFYPGTANASEAQFVSVGRSQEVSRIDVALSRTRTAKIAGQVVNAAGVPANPGSLSLIPSVRSESIVSVQLGARISGEGVFEFPNVPPGAYIIRADRGRSNATEGEFGTLPVAVNGTDVTGLILQTSAGSSIDGRVRFDAFNGTKLPAPSAIELSPMPIDYDLAPANTASAEIHPDWSFEVAGINGPRRLQLLRAPAEWALKEIRVRGADMTDRPIAFGRRDQSLTDVEVVLTDRISRLDGTVVDDQRRAVARAQVMVFSTDRVQWYAASRFMRRTMADADGAFSAAGLPFGSYYAVAVARLPFATDEEWQDPAFLESMVRRATSVTIGEGQTMTLRLAIKN
jgi:protocatechuate 3,4-dioxygenase beta subunit